MPKASNLPSICGIAQAVSFSDFTDRARDLLTHDIDPKKKASKR
jgi:hypothetical protein